MLRKEPTGRFESRRASFFDPTERRWRFHVRSMRCNGELNPHEYHRLLEQQAVMPVVVMTSSGPRWWWMFKAEFYSVDEGLQPSEVRALILDKAERARRTVQRAIARQARSLGETAGERTAIPDDVKLFVWQRDHGRCIQCGSNRELEFDHIIPFVSGGSSTARNLQLLCAPCNRSKGGNLI